MRNSENYVNEKNMSLYANVNTHEYVKKIGGCLDIIEHVNIFLVNKIKKTVQILFHVTKA